MFWFYALVVAAVLCAAYALGWIDKLIAMLPAGAVKTAVTKADAAVDNAVGNAVTVAAKTSAGSEAGSLGIQAAMRVFQERGQADLVQQLAPFIGNLWAYVPPPVSTVTVSTPVAVVTTTGETVQVNPAPAVTAT